jgi:hypothetical protein
LDYPVSHSRLSDFDSFRAKVRKELNLKIQDVLKQAKGLKGIKGPRYKKIKQETKVAKTRLSGFGYRSIQFSQNR